MELVGVLTFFLMFFYLNPVLGIIFGFLILVGFGTFGLF